jgi:hypothetical protein
MLTGVNVSFERPEAHLADRCLCVRVQGAGSGDLYSCSTKGCGVARRGEKRAGRRYLVDDPPQVFCLGLVWDSLKGDAREIEALTGVIQPTTRLDALLLPAASRGGEGKGQRGGGGEAELRGFFAFHPQKHHYVAFLYHHASGRWICLDDSEVRRTHRPLNLAPTSAPHCSC